MGWAHLLQYWFPIERVHSDSSHRHLRGIAVRESYGNLRRRARDLRWSRYSSPERNIISAVKYFGNKVLVSSLQNQRTTVSLFIWNQTVFPHHRFQSDVPFRRLVSKYKFNCTYIFNKPDKTHFSTDESAQCAPTYAFQHFVVRFCKALYRKW